MGNISLSVIVLLICILIEILLLLWELYLAFRCGKLIIKVKKSRVLLIFVSGLLVLWSLSLVSNIRDYMQFKVNFNINNFAYSKDAFDIMGLVHNMEDGLINSIIRDILWIVLSMDLIIRTLKGTELRQNGIYNYGYFCKWRKIRSYSWISPDTVRFSLNKLFGIRTSFKITVKDELKPKTEEVLQRYLSS